MGLAGDERGSREGKRHCPLQLTIPRISDNIRLTISSFTEKVSA